MAVLLGLIGILLYTSPVSIPLLDPYKVWLLIVAFALLVLGCLFKGL